MAYDVQLNLPSDWQKEAETYVDESDVEVTHIEAHLYDGKNKHDIGMIDIYVGDLPEDTGAEDQAFSNYADMVGFSDDDPEDFNPVYCLEFNGRKAYCFDAMCEDDSPMRLLTQEVRKGILAIMCIAASDEARLDEVQSILERGLRVK